MIQRYKRHNGLTKDPEGEYVRWEDHCAEVERLKDDLMASRVGAEAWKAIAERAESENKELRQQVEALQAKVHLCAGYDAMEAKLKAIEGLLPGWKEGDFNLDDYTRGIMDGCHKCADELESRLKGEQP